MWSNDDDVGVWPIVIDQIGMELAALAAELVSCWSGIESRFNPHGATSQSYSTAWTDRQDRLGSSYNRNHVGIVDDRHGGSIGQGRDSASPPAAIDKMGELWITHPPRVASSWTTVACDQISRRVDGEHRSPVFRGDVCAAARTVGSAVAPARGSAARGEVGPGCLRPFWLWPR